LPPRRLSSTAGPHQQAGRAPTRGRAPDRAADSSRGRRTFSLRQQFPRRPLEVLQGGPRASCNAVIAAATGVFARAPKEGLPPSCRRANRPTRPQEKKTQNFQKSTAPKFANRRRIQSVFAARKRHRLSTQHQRLAASSLSACRKQGRIIGHPRRSATTTPSRASREARGQPVALPDLGGARARAAAHNSSPLITAPPGDGRHAELGPHRKTGGAAEISRGPGGTTGQQLFRRGLPHRARRGSRVAANSPFSQSLCALPPRCPGPANAPQPWGKHPLGPGGSGAAGEDCGSPRRAATTSQSDGIS